MTAGDAGGQAPACNIGAEETTRRRRIGFIGLVLAIAWIIAVEVFGLSLYFRLMLFFPATIAFSGFLQARARFCMAYGARGVSSLDGLQQFARTADPDGDRHRAAMMLGRVILYSLLVSALYAFLP